jgi:hypothetical protein
VQRRFAFLLLCFLTYCLLSAEARVVRVEIRVRADVLNGQPFGLAGPYEKIVARVHYAVKPGHARNRGIVDLDKAPRNAAGEVEFSADFYVLQPKDAARGNGALLLEIPNRGGKGILSIVNGGAGSLDPTTAAHFGDGFLMRNGFTVAWVGWQADVRDGAERLRLYAPVARGKDGPIRGLVRADFNVPARQFDHPLGHWIGGAIGGKGYAVAQPDDARNVLTVRDTPASPRRTIPRSEWQFAREVDGKVTRDEAYIRLNSGFEPGKIYEVVYMAQDPLVVGLGFAAVRDLAAYLKHDKDAVAPVKYAYSVGISQSGRFLRHLLYQDFNADEEDRMALDGVISHVAGGGRGSFNHRFAQPSRDGQPFSSLFYPTDVYPFADMPVRDPETGEARGLLDRPIASRTLPKVFYTNTSYEYWSRAASLVHTNLDGTADVAPHENVRIYLYAGLQHFTGPFPPQPGQGDIRGRWPQNPLPVRWFWRSAITNLDRWVREGVAPPASVYPRVADGTLTALDKLAFPKIPRVTTPSTVHLAYRQDFGPDFEWKGIITKEPPVIGQPFASLVPQVDQDGNDLGGVRLPQLEAPLATYAPWNLRHPDIGAPEQRVSFIGSYLPLARTRAEREASGDPRPSIEERYSTRDQYMGLFTAAALKLVKDRFLMPEDLPALLERGAAEWEHATGSAK